MRKGPCRIKKCCEIQIEALRNCNILCHASDPSRSYEGLYLSKKSYKGFNTDGFTDQEEF